MQKSKTEPIGNEALIRQLTAAGLSQDVRNMADGAIRVPLEPNLLQERRSAT